MPVILHSKSITYPACTDPNKLGPQDWNSTHNQFVTLTGNTQGGSTWSGTNLILSGGTNITLSLNGNSLGILGGGGGAGVAIQVGSADGLAFSGSASSGTVTFLRDGAYKQVQGTRSQYMNARFAMSGNSIWGYVEPSFHDNFFALGYWSQTSITVVPYLEFYRGDSIFDINVPMGDTPSGYNQVAFGSRSYTTEQTIALYDDLLRFGVSTGGNTGGTTGIVTGASKSLVLVGSNNITLSQSSGAGGATISIYGAAAGTGGGIMGINLDDNYTATSGTVGILAGNYMTASVVTTGGVQNINIHALHQFVLSAGGYSTADNVSFSTAHHFSMGLNSNGYLTARQGPMFDEDDALFIGYTSASATSSPYLGFANGPNYGTLSMEVGSLDYAVVLRSFTDTANTHTLALDQDLPAMGVSTHGNTGGSTGLVSGLAQKLLLVGSNNITLSQSSNTAGATVSIIGGAGGGGVAISASNSLWSSGTVTFTGSNNITVGTAAGQIVFSGPNTHAQQTGISGLSVPSTAYTSGTVVLTGSNGVTVTSSGAGQTIIVSGSVAPAAIVASNSTLASGSVVLTGSNNVTVSYNGQTIQISGANTHAQQTGISGIAGSGASTVTNGTVQFANANSVSFGLNGSTMTASFSATQSTGPSAIVASNTTITSGSVVLSASTNITISQNGQTVLFSCAAPGGGGGINGIAATPATTYTSGTVYLSEQANITINTSVNGASQYFRFSVAAPGGGAVTLSALAWNNPSGARFIASQYPGNASVQVWWEKIEANYTFSKFLASVSLAVSTSSNSSHGGTLSVGFGFYTRNGSTLSLASSGLGTYAWTNTSNNSTASLTGLREVSGTFAAMNLTPGEYWIAFWSRTSTANANWFTASNVIFETSNSGLVHSGSFMAAAAGASFQPGLPGRGYWSGTSNVLPVSMAFSHITGSQRWFYIPHVAFRNYNG